MPSSPTALKPALLPSTSPETPGLPPPETVPAASHYLHNVGTVSSRDKVQGQGEFPCKIETLLGHFHVCIDFIGHHNAQNLWPELPKLHIPGAQVLVCDFPLYIKYHDADMGLVIAGSVHALEPLLACCVPKVHKDSLAIYCGHVLVQGQGICGQLLMVPML